MKNTYLITGKNAAREEGTWEIEAENEKSLNEIIKDRGLQADKINGELGKPSLMEYYQYPEGKPRRR